MENETLSKVMMKTMDEIHQLDADDESLVKYKKTLLGEVDKDASKQLVLVFKPSPLSLTSPSF